MTSIPRLAAQDEGAAAGWLHHPPSARKTRTSRIRAVDIEAGGLGGPHAVAPAYPAQNVRSRAEAPQAHDSVAVWFAPLLSERLAQAGFGTLEQLAQRINDTGTTWWYPVRGIGVRRAERVVQWLHEQQESTGIRMNPRNLQARGHGPCSKAASEHAAG
ncbi:phage integrase family protein [Variovorax gossypii]|uniref:phage integrase family protein n=1 Tax=Variovorax gossypii TaxID=1679495 RepID=UPI001F0C50AD|nr:phage integrase family protein [Variovorax gossypii]